MPMRNHTRFGYILFAKVRKNIHVSFGYLSIEHRDITRLLYYKSLGCLGYTKRERYSKKATSALGYDFRDFFMGCVRSLSLAYLTVQVRGFYDTFRRFWKPVWYRYRGEVFYRNRVRRERARELARERRSRERWFNKTSAKHRTGINLPKPSPKPGFTPEHVVLMESLLKHLVPQPKIPTDAGDLSS